MSIMEIFEWITLVTGVIYVILEILQKNSMWILGVVTSLGAMVVYGMQFVENMHPDSGTPGLGLSSFLLYTYYFAISFYGFYKWSAYKKQAVSEVKEEQTDVVVMNHLHKKEVTLAVALFVAGIVLYPQFLKEIGLWTESLASWLETLNVVLSAIATYWLAKAYIQQWYIWIFTNALFVWYNISTGLWAMAALMVVYVISAVFGYIHWKKNGRYVNE